MVQFLAFIIVSGIHGGTYPIKNTDEALKQLYRIQRGDNMFIRNIGHLRIRKVDSNIAIVKGVEMRYIYISVDKIHLIKN